MSPCSFFISWWARLGHNWHLGFDFVCLQSQFQKDLTSNYSIKRNSTGGIDSPSITNSNIHTFTRAEKLFLLLLLLKHSKLLLRPHSKMAVSSSYYLHAVGKAYLSSGSRDTTCFFLHAPTHLVAVWPL